MRWISTKKSFPIEGQPVLVFIEYEEKGEVLREMSMAYWNEELSGDDYDTWVKDWRFLPCSCCAPRTFNVLFWMSLPDSPLVPERKIDE